MLAHGKRRAAARLEGGRYRPHPGMENFLPPARLRDQAVALRIVEQLVAAQHWRSDRRTAWLAILRQLVCCMDWQTGLVSAVTAERLGAAGHRATRTVSRVMSWAVQAGLLVIAEKPASPAFLGSTKGRTATYALYRPPGLPAADRATPDPASEPPSDAENAQVNDATGELGVVPHLSVGNKPLNGRRLEPTTPPPASWPVYRVPESSSERNLAAQCLLRRLGLDHGGVSRVPLWRTRALLKPWWDAGACPAALLHAIDRHPDRPDHHRGDALRGTRDPLRSIGARLRPWQGRLAELDAKLIGFRGDYTADTTAARLAANPITTTKPAEPFVPTSPESHRAKLCAGYAAERAQARRARRCPTSVHSS